LQAVRVVGIRKRQPRGGSKNAAHNQFQVWNSVWPIHLSGVIVPGSNSSVKKSGTLNHYVRDLLRHPLADEMTALPLHSQLPGELVGIEEPR
jgi:hypothetical protein